MNWESALLWGFAGTVMLTTALRSSEALGLTRMDIPFMLGTMLTANRDLAKVLGSLVHFVNGWIFAFIYIAFFESLDSATWWLGIGIGLMHSIFVLMVGLPILPGVHPRMASDFSGPEPTRQLEPPGYLALNYGRRTPIATVAAHLLFGAVLGTFYRVA
jgi:hypothetical protein